MIRSSWLRLLCDLTIAPASSPLAGRLRCTTTWPLIQRLGLLLSGICLTLPLGSRPAIADFVPPDAGLPGRRASGGTRGGCVVGRPANLIALLPDSNVGRTTEAFPTFRWYVPQSSAEAMRFQLYIANPNQPDAPGMLLYETTQPVPSEGGIVSLPLPQTGEAQPLVMGRSYRWSVDLICDVDNPAVSLNITGWVQRVLLDSAIATELADADLAERIEIYGTNGLWFDYLAAIAALPPSEQEEADALFLETLTTVGLDELAELYSNAAQ